MTNRCTSDRTYEIDWISFRSGVFDSRKNPANPIKLVHTCFMNERRKPYPFDQIEPKWQAIWDERGAFRTPNPGEREFRPGETEVLHPRHVPLPERRRSCTSAIRRATPRRISSRATSECAASTCCIRWAGMPSACRPSSTPSRPGSIPRSQRARTSRSSKRSSSASVSPTIGTARSTRPIRDYFKWTQWIFLKLYNSWFNPGDQKAEPISTLSWPTIPTTCGSLIVADAPVNWCPELGTVLANEEVIDGKSEVGGFPVVRRPMRQWMLRITAYAERLLDGTRRPRLAGGHQSFCKRNWIGRSEGAEIVFAIAREGESDPGIRVFTTRPDTLYGATYMVLAPEHPLVDQLTTADRQAGGRKNIGKRSPRNPISNAPNWPRKKPACSPALTRSIRSTASRFRSGSPITC